MRFLFTPFLFFSGIFRVLLLVVVIVFIVRLVSHRHDHVGHWHGHGQWDAQVQDPARIAAMRYASGRIDRAEFDRIMTALGTPAPTPPAPAAPPVPPTA